MPSRFNIKDDSNIHRLLAELNCDFGSMPNRFNIAPTDQVPVIHKWEGQRIISDMRWWLVPHWCKEASTDYPMFNARCETLESSRAFQGCLRYKRCIIPAHSFIEWQNIEDQKMPYLLSAINQSLAFAGLWDYWTNGIEHILSCTIITTPAINSFKQYNSRMPVLLNNTNANLWLDHNQEITSVLPLLKSTLPYDLQATAIDPITNSTKNKVEPTIIGNEILLKTQH